MLSNGKTPRILCDPVFVRVQFVLAELINNESQRVSPVTRFDGISPAN
jgi:hypothetical protein